MAGGPRPRAPVPVGDFRRCPRCGRGIDPDEDRHPDASIVSGGRARPYPARPSWWWARRIGCKTASTVGGYRMEHRRLGRLGHDSSVLVYGAAALSAVDQDTADASIQQALDAGINSFDVAASYGDAELRLGPWMAGIRDRIFLATKTEDRDREAAWASINRSCSGCGPTGSTCSSCTPSVISTNSTGHSARVARSRPLLASMFHSTPDEGCRAGGCRLVWVIVPGGCDRSAAVARAPVPAGGRGSPGVVGAGLPVSVGCGESA